MSDVWQTLNEKYWTPLRTRTQKHVLDPLDTHLFTPLQTRVLAIRQSILPQPKNAYLLPPLPDACWISISSFCATSDFLHLRRVSLKHRRLSRYAPSWSENNTLTIRFKSLKQCRSASAVYEHILFALNKIPAPIKHLRLIGSSKHYGSQVDESDPHLASIDDNEDEAHHTHQGFLSNEPSPMKPTERSKGLWEKLEEVGEFLGALHSPSSKSKEVFAMHTHMWLAIIQLAERTIEERKKNVIRFVETGEDFAVPILPMLPAHVRGQSIPSFGSLSSFSSTGSLKSLSSRSPSLPNSLPHTPTLRSFNSSRNQSRSISRTNSACPSPRPIPPASNLSRNSSTGSYMSSPSPSPSAASASIDPMEYLFILFQHLTSFEIQWVDVDPVGISQVLEAWCTSHGNLSKVALRHVQMKPSMEKFLAPEIHAVKPGFIKKAYGASLRSLYIDSLPKSDIEIDPDTQSRINTHLVQVCAYFGYECETLSLRVTNIEGKHLSFISSMFFPRLAHLHLNITPEPTRPALPSTTNNNNTPSSTSAWSILSLDFPEPFAYHSYVPQIPIIDFLYVATLPLRTLHLHGRSVTWEMLDALAGNPQHQVIVDAASNRLRTHLQVANGKPQSTSSSPIAGSLRPTMDWRKLTAPLRNNLQVLHVHNASAFQGRDLASLSHFRQLQHLSLLHATHLTPVDLMRQLDSQCLQELSGLDTQGLDKHMWDSRVITRLFQHFRDHFPKMILQHNFEGIAVVAWNNRD